MAVVGSPENPKSVTFDLDKNSPLVSKLRVPIGEKLHEIVGSHTDHAVEYILVLVCNGKDQNQMKVDLKDILGKRSGEFVSWLWDLLMKSLDQKHTPMGLSYLKTDVCRSERASNGGLENTRGLHILKDLSNQATKDVDVLVSSNGTEASKGSHNSPGFNTSIYETNEMEGWTRTVKQAIHGNSNSGPTGNDYSQVLKFGPSSVIVCSGNEPRVSHVNVNERMHILKRIVSSHCDNVNLQNKELQSRNLQSEKPKYMLPTVTNVVGRRSLRPVDSVSHEKAKPRVSVWDRLGKPSRDNRIVTIKDTDFRGIDVVKRKRVGDPGKAHVQNRLMLIEPAGTLNEQLKRESPAPDNSFGTVIPSTNDDYEYKRSVPELNIMCLPHPADNSTKKRQFSVIGSGSANDSVSLRENKYGNLQDTKTLTVLQRSSSAMYSHSKSLNCVSSGTKLREELHTSSERFEPPDSAFVHGANNVSRRKLSGEALKATPHPLVSNCLVTRSEPVSTEVAMKTNLKPAHVQMLDMKLRLHQIEEEMSKLKAKQLENKECKPDLLSNSGALSHSDDNVETRTVCVTNVHFAATKEALSLHFAKCGVVVNVSLVHDAVTAQPKGVAYITFACKESTDKAISLSGISFWSRTLKVMRKADMPVVTSVPPHPAGKASQSQSSHSNRKVVPKPYVGSLRWQRDQPVTTGLSISTPRQGLEASGIAEQICNNSGRQLHNLLNTKTSMTKEEKELLENPEAGKCKETPEGCKRNLEEEESKKSQKEEEPKETPNEEDPMEMAKEEGSKKTPEEEKSMETLKEEEEEPRKTQEEEKEEFKETPEEEEPKKSWKEEEPNTTRKEKEPKETPDEEGPKETPDEEGPRETPDDKEPEETPKEEESKKSQKEEEPKETPNEEEPMETAKEEEPKETPNEEEPMETAKEEESKKTPVEENSKVTTAEVTPKEDEEKPKKTREEEESKETPELQEPKNTQEEGEPKDT